MPSPSDNGTPRCLLCSMACSIGAQDDGFGHVSTLYPNDLGVAGGACVRALTAARLLRARERIFTGRKGSEAALADEVMRALATGGSRFDAAQMAVLVDVNRPLEGVLAVAALCEMSGVGFAPCIPPQDEALVAAGLTSCPPFGELAACDLLLAVGDPFSSHPAVAGHVRDMQFGERGRRLVCIDAAWGRTSRGAEQALTVGPLKMAGFVAALAVACGAGAVAESLGGTSVEDICGALAIPVEQVTGLAADLKSADSVGIILSQSVGRYAAPAAVAAAVREMAGALEAKLWPLLVSTNSAVLPRLKEKFGAVGLGDVVREAESGRLKALLVVGVDPASVLPERLWGRLVEGCEVVAWAGSLRSPFAEQADFVVPLALAWEEEGTVLDAAGQPARFVPWMSRPSTVLTVNELMADLVGYAGGGALAASRVEELTTGIVARVPAQDLIGPAILEGEAPGKGQAIVIGSPEPHGYTGGISLAQSSWQTRLAAEERASLSPALADELDMSGPGLVELRNGLATTVACEAAAAGDGRVVALPAHWQALRELLQWRGVDGRIEPAPALVNIRKA